MVEKSINIVNVNGKEFWIEDESTFGDFLEAVGLTKDDVVAYMYDRMMDEFIAEAARWGQCSSMYGDGFDGLIGDSYFKYRDAIKSEIDDLNNDIYASLLSPSRKGNTKADIAKRLKNIIDNLYDIY